MIFRRELIILLASTFFCCCAVRLGDEQEVACDGLRTLLDAATAARKGASPEYNGRLINIAGICSISSAYSGFIIMDLATNGDFRQKDQEDVLARRDLRNPEYGGSSSEDVDDWLEDTCPHYAYAKNAGGLLDSIIDNYVQSGKRGFADLKENASDPNNGLFYALGGDNGKYVLKSPSNKGGQQAIWANWALDSSPLFEGEASGFQYVEKTICLPSYTETAGTDSICKFGFGMCGSWAKLCSGPLHSWTWTPMSMIDARLIKYCEAGRASCCGSKELYEKSNLQANMQGTFDYIKWTVVSAGGRAEKAKWAGVREASRREEAARVPKTTAGECVHEGYFPGCTCKPCEDGHHHHHGSCVECTGAKLTKRDYHELRKRCRASASATSAFQGASTSSAKKACDSVKKKDQQNAHETHLAVLFAKGDKADEWYEQFLPAAVEAGIDQIVGMIEDM